MDGVVAEYDDISEVVDDEAAGEVDANKLELCKEKIRDYFVHPIKRNLFCR